MKWIITALCVLTLVGCKAKEEPETSDHFLRMLSLPPVPLAEGERISGLQINMSCGRFRAVNRIPNDWSLEIEGPVSERSTLKAVANHGTSWLPNSSNLQDFATILVCSTSHFDITATIFINDDERKQTFQKNQLRLEKWPNKTPHGICR